MHRRVHATVTGDAPEQFRPVDLPNRAVGTGLGLAIVKELTEAMGGTAMVTSLPGRGTTFVVQLPSPAS